MSHLIIAKWDENGVIQKINNTEAITLEKVQEKYPQAFITEHPQKDLSLYRVQNGALVESAEAVAQKESQEAKQKLRKLDDGHIRTIDDLIDILVNNGTINIDDLPQSVKERYNTRKTLRSKL